MPAQPNLILIIADQMRGDCLGADGHPIVQTPQLDRLAARGTRFTAAYSSCPSCIAARASLFTGLRPTSHGRLGYQDQVPWRYTHTLAEELAGGGYQTHCVGKTHFFPQKLPLGFESQESYEAAQNFSSPDHPYVNDYHVWLAERTKILETDHGLDWNSWKPGVSVLPEPWHNNSWVVERGLAFVKTRDPHRPLFLNLSFHRPHAPLDPPADFFERYRNTPIPPIPVGDWAAAHDLPVTNPNAWHGHLPTNILAEARRAYYAQISHIDHVIGRFIESYERLVQEPTWWIFTSDHGEMLGDHHHFRKTYGYEGSARIPFLVIPPASSHNPVSNAPVLLEDIMPSLLDAAGLPCPAHVEGRSVLPLLSNPDVSWRPYLHGEHSACYDPHNGIQYLTDGRTKYIWHTVTGGEDLFDLTHDRDELHNLATNPHRQDLLKFWRQRLIEELAPRTQDGLSDGKRLTPGICLPPCSTRLAPTNRGIMNPKLSLIFKRRSVRRFTAESISDALIRDLLEAAMAAPSAVAKDPWRFHVVRDSALRNRIADGLPNGQMLRQAPVGIFVEGDLSLAHSGELSYLIQDCSAAIENLLLAATALDLGACWLGVHPRPDRIALLRALFKLPDHRIPVALIALGHPDEHPTPRTRYREEAVHWGP